MLKGQGQNLLGNVYYPLRITAVQTVVPRWWILVTTAFRVLQEIFVPTHGLSPCHKIPVLRPVRAWMNPSVLCWAGKMNYKDEKVHLDFKQWQVWKLLSVLTQLCISRREERWGEERRASLDKPLSSGNVKPVGERRVQMKGNRDQLP